MTRRDLKKRLDALEEDVSNTFAEVTKKVVLKRREDDNRKQTIREKVNRVTGNDDE